MSRFFTSKQAVIVAAMVCCASCWNPRQNKPQSPSSEHFELPTIPMVYTQPEQRAEYLALHWWDKFDFTDTTLAHRPEITEQGFADFVNIQSTVTPEITEKAVTVLMDKAIVDSTLFAYFAKLSEKYLWDPNSPLRNEEMYIAVLRYIIASDQVDKMMKIRPQYQLNLALKNRPGTVATDFTYTLANRKTGRLSAIQANYTILFFNNPDCHDCQRIKEYIETSPIIQSLVTGNSKTANRQTLVLLAIYTDPDLPLWLKASYPKQMINAYDAGQILTNQQLYDLKAIPTLYLLDLDKRVILKDAPIEQIEAWLSTNAH